MALIPRHRRYLGPMALALLVLVMLGALVPDPMRGWQAFRVPGATTAPGGAINHWARAIREFVGDDFGYAHTLPYLRGIVEYALLSPSDRRVFFGRHAHLYYGGEGVVGQSTGSLYRQENVLHFVNVVAALERTLAPRGTHLLVLVPPNAQSIPTQYLPPWWQISGPLEYDLAIRELRNHHIATVDLKAAFAATPDADHLYRHADTHWRWNAALTAFNLAMRAIGRANWSIDPAKALSPPTPVRGGDLSMMLGLQDELPDYDYGWRLSASHRAWRPIDLFRAPPYGGVFFPYAFEQASGSERVLVLGDSYTDMFWQPMLQETGAARVGWMHFQECAFDFNDVERFEPTYLIVAPNERYLACDLQHWPHGLPTGAPSS